MNAMFASMVIILLNMVMHIKSLYWVILAYSLGGIGIGTFEANFLNYITTLGQQSKRLAISGIPVGMSSVFVGGFLAMGSPFYLTPSHIYVSVATAILLAMVLMQFGFPTPQQTSLAIGCERLRSDVRNRHCWLPIVSTYPLAFAVDCFALSCFAPGVALMIYDTPWISLLPGWYVASDTFFAVFNMGSALGGITGRLSSFWLRERHPMFYNLLTLAGIAVILMRMPLLAPIGSFCIMLGDGLIYGTISRRIDTHVAREFNLIAISFWLCIGDMGSVLGSNSMSYIRDAVVGN
jgi:hypothetical protein